MLIVDEPAPAGAVVVPWSGDGRYDEAARLRDADADAVALVRMHPNRLRRVGALPTPERIALKALAARGVPEYAVAILPADARNEWDVARALAVWLEARPDATAVVLCDEFSSRRMRLVVDRTAGPAADRIRIRALRHRWVSPDDWWLGKDGLKQFFGSAVGLTYALVLGEDDDPWIDWDTDAWAENLPRP
jgi:hypothetical protein